MSHFDILLLDRPPAFILEDAASIGKLHKIYDAADPQAALNSVKPEIQAILSYGLSRKLDGAYLQQFPKLEIISHHGVGYDVIDAQWCRDHNIIVTHTPDVLNEEVADLAMGLLLAATRQIPQADAYVRSGHWRTGAFPLTASLQGRKLGILGLGRIGRAVAKRAEAFGLTIGYHNRHKIPDVPYTYFDGLKQMASACDTLILMAPGSLETRHIVNMDILETLGPNGILVNVARGSLVDEIALIKALREGRILAAGLDVFEQEPNLNPELLSLPNVVLLPHVGSASLPTRHAMGQLVVDNLRSFFAGKGPLTPVPETPWV